MQNADDPIPSHCLDGRLHKNFCRNDHTELHRIQDQILGARIASGFGITLAHFKD